MGGEKSNFPEQGANGNRCRDGPGVLALAMGCSMSGVNGTWKFLPPSSVPEEQLLSSVDGRSTLSNKHRIFCSHHHHLLPGFAKAFKQPIFVISYRERKVSFFSPWVATA